MIIISCNALGIPNTNFKSEDKEIVARVNLAWQKNKQDAEAVLTNLSHKIYLDYPQGRTKPPKPTISLDEALELAEKFKVKYFAVSNAEDPKAMLAIKQKLPSVTELVPKIETKKGVLNLENIAQTANIKYVMLDKDDLYIDVNRDQEIFENLIKTVRNKCSSLGIRALELSGVIFT